MTNNNNQTVHDIDYQARSVANLTVQGYGLLYQLAAHRARLDGVSDYQLNDWDTVTNMQVWRKYIYLALLDRALAEVALRPLDGDRL